MYFIRSIDCESTLSRRSSGPRRSGNVGEKVAIPLPERDQWLGTNGGRPLPFLPLLRVPPLFRLLEKRLAERSPYELGPLSRERSPLSSRLVRSDRLRAFRTEHVGTRQLLHPSRFNEPDRFHRSAARAAPAKERVERGRGQQRGRGINCRNGGTETLRSCVYV